MDPVKKILIVEDETALSTELQYVAKAFNYEVYSTDGIIPINEITLLSPDLVVFNKTNSADAIIRLCFDMKTSGLSKGFKTLVVAANPELERMAVENCADACLKKPYHIDDLLLITKHLLQTPNLQPPLWHC
jgi:DNA-binding response OmpR family regulator